MKPTKPIHIGTVIRNAHIFNIQNWQEGAMNSENLLQTVAQLFALLQQRRMNYVLVGGIALLQYIPGRNTEDIDLILAVSALKKLPEIQITSQDVFFARGLLADLQIDFLLTRNPLFAHVQRTYATLRQFQEQEIMCATVEGLVLLKLSALPSLYHQGDFARVGLYENDLATLIYYHQPDLPALLNELAAYVSASDLTAIRETVADIQQRIARFQKGTSTSEESAS